MKEFFRIIYVRLYRHSGRAAKVLEALGAIMLFLALLTLIFQILYRFIIIRFVNFSFPFTEEFAKYLLVWSVYIIIGVNLREGTMVAVNFIYDRLGKKSKKGLFYFTRLLIFIFLTVSFVFSLKVINQNMNFRSATIQAPGWLLFMAPAVGLILLFVEILIELCGVLGGIVEPFGGHIAAQQEIEQQDK
jgi:TRAP-type C4-dicarboxylate transport system permease small subunit